MKRNSRGMGHFRENEDGSVTYRKSVGYKPDGHRKTLTVTAKNKVAAIKEMNAKEEEWKLEKNKKTVRVKMTLCDLCRRHLEYQVERKELKPKSIDRREVTIEHHIAPRPEGNMQISAITFSDIEKLVMDLLDEGRLSASSLEKVVDVVNAAFNWAVLKK